MWLILLDASGSMANPFEAATQFAGRQRGTLAQIKIDAAREALVLHLQGLGEATQAAIFAFRNKAELIYDGPSDDTVRIRTVLDGIKATNGTDIAAALLAARDHVDSRPTEPVFRVLLISDGLSDAAAAEAASRQLLALRIPVDIILIDPSEKGDELARRVAGSYGSVTAVTSTSEMATAIGDVGATVRAEAAAVEQAKAGLGRATAGLRARGSDDDLSFTAAYPSELAKDRWGSVLLFIHLSSLSQEARNRALGLGQAKGSDTLSASVRSSTRLPRGTEITLIPRLPGFDVNPPSAVIAWHEDIQDLEFRIRPTYAPEGPAIGEIEVSVRGLPIGRVPLAVLVGSAKGPRPAELEAAVSTGGVFLTIFASHARTDAQVVQACAAIYAGLGIYLIIDKEALIAGQLWRPAIRALLAGSDAFQLFWSEAASVSPPVSEEILDALTIQGDRGTGFIRPVFWDEPCPPLPSELKHLNFTFLDFKRLQETHGETDSETRRTQGREKPLKGAPNIPIAVLPLLPATPAAITHEIRIDIAFAVAFIENAVGSRYYPVPTLLVDRHTVLAVRAEQTVDYDELEKERQRVLADWGEILASICLAFHGRSFWEDVDYSTEAAFETSRQVGLEDAAFRGLIAEAEAVSSWFVPRWHRGSLDRVPGMANATTLQVAVATVIDAAMKSAVDPQTPLKVVKSQLDNWWPVWQEELQKLGLTCIRGGFDAELNGTAATFRAGLDHLWNYFEPILARNGDRFAERTTLDARLRAALRIADAICGGLFGDRYWGGLTDCVLPEIDPDRGWTGARTKLVATGLQGILPDQEFSEFAGVFFRTVVQVLRQRALEVGDIYVKRACDIPPSSWELLRASGIASGLRVNIALKRLYRSGDNVPVEGPISAFIDALEGAWKFAADLLRRRMSAGSRFLMADVPTYGIFAPNNATDADVQLADKAREWGVPLALFLPSTDRVLLCAEALDDFRAVLNKSGDGLNAARLFLRSVLVHEHFHAFARTAPMDDGSPPPGPGFQSHWTDALPVNEAIAAWMQVHFARDEADLRERIWDYIKSGSYPQWPYAGAALIEEAYTEKGLDAVRSLIHLLRIDPPRASAWMREKAAAIGTVLNQGKAEIAPDMQ